MPESRFAVSRRMALFVVAAMAISSCVTLLLVKALGSGPIPNPPPLAAAGGPATVVAAGGSYGGSGDEDDSDSTGGTDAESDSDSDGGEAGAGPATPSVEAAPLIADGDDDRFVVTHAKEVPMTDAHSMWCWASSVAMITGYLCGDAGVSQCEAASDPFFQKGQQDKRYCCDPAHTVCEDAGNPLFRFHGYSVKIRKHSAPDWKRIVQEIEHGRLLGIVQTENQATAHMRVVTGYGWYQRKKMVEVYDPSGPGSYLWYIDHEFRASPGVKVNQVYYRIRPSATATCAGKGCGKDKPAAKGAPCIQKPVELTVHATPPASPSPPAATQIDAAEQGLDVVRAIGRAHPISVGYDSVEQAEQERPKLADEVAVEQLDLPLIKKGFSILPKLARTPIHWHPYTLGGQQVGYVGVLSKGKGWRSVVFGLSSAARDIASTRKMFDSLAAARPVSLIYIPSLDLSLWRLSNDKISPVRDVPGIHRLLKGHVYEPSELVESLKSIPDLPDTSL